jgi:hypothetical protein
MLPLAHITLAGLLTGVLAVLINRQWPVVSHLTDGRVVLPTGVPMNTNTGQPAHPEEVESDFRDIYKAIVAYRKETGMLPVRGGGFDLIDFAKSHPDIKLTEEDLLAQDVTQSDDYAQGMRNHLEYRFHLRAWRPNHVTMPAFPKPGERDAWVSSNVYARRNTVIYPNMTARSQPSGFHIVLWSDGSIERIPVDETLFVSESDGLTEYFPGQAGLPKNARKAKRVLPLLSNGVPAGITPDNLRRPAIDKSAR